jgi:hypothetical protein
LVLTTRHGKENQMLVAQKHAQIMHKTCTKYAQNMHKICTKYAQNMHKICKEVAKGMHIGGPSLKSRIGEELQGRQGKLSK